MKSILGIGLAAALAGSALFPAMTTAQTKVGGGIHYLRTVGDIKDAPEFDENALGIMGSVTWPFALLRVEADLEWIPDYGGSSEALLVPQAWALIGSSLYGGAGIGIGRFDGDWQDHPFYALRAGLIFDLAGMDLDLFASYHFQNAKMLEDLDEDDLDAVTFGALLRFTLD